MLVQLTQAGLDLDPIARVTITAPAAWAILHAGLADADALARKRCRQALGYILSAYPQPAGMPQEAWDMVHEAWGHWQALYDSLDSYSLQLLQATWHAHLPQLLQLVNATSAQAYDMPLELNLQIEQTGSAAGGLTAADGKQPAQYGWLCLLFNRALAHENPAVQRFLALRALDAFGEGEGRVNVPWRWLFEHLAPAVVQGTLTPSAADVIETVSSVTESAPGSPCNLINCAPFRACVRWLPLILHQAAAARLSAATEALLSLPPALR